MPYAAVLDASVIYPLPLRDTLLRVAATGLYVPYWSDRILDEVARNLVDHGRATAPRAERLVEVMNEAFPAALLPSEAIEKLEPAMTNDPNDRHVLAAAVASGADAVVTSNVRHFPLAACEPFAIEPLHPDDFLLDLYRLDEHGVHAVVERQAAVLSRPPMTVGELIDRLAVTVPSFAQALRR